MRKTGTTDITSEIMKKIWKLHENQVKDTNLIAETIGISNGSVCRIIKIMTAAKNGEDVDSLGGSGHKKQKKFAKEFFGVQKKAEAPKEEADESAILLKAHAAIEYQNELLKKQNEILTKICVCLGVSI